VNGGVVLVLDSLFDNMSIETDAAESAGWSVERWDGTEERLATAEVVVHVGTRIDATMLARMPRCRVVGRFGTGIDTVDVAAATAAGVAVVTVRDYCIPELSTHTLGLAFALERRIRLAADGRLNQDRTWQEVALDFPIAGRTAATVVGFGAIGSAVTRALLACDYRVAVVTAHGAERARELGAEVVALEEGLRRGEIVFLHTALTKKTARLIDRRRLAAMPDGAILVDTARLGLIDEAAVADALDSGRLGGLGLDARLAADSPLRPRLGDPRVLVTPHIGWYSERSAAALRARTIVETIAHWLPQVESVPASPRSTFQAGGRDV
jgi:phosphoglycerate dehydrogenase-like enzyme